MKSLLNIKIVLILIILVAAIFRLMAVNWGLPFKYNDDETNYIETAMRFGIGKFNPDKTHLVHGLWFPEILFFIYGLFFLIGNAIGMVTSKTSFLLTYLRDPSIFFILARLITITFSMGSLCLTYTIAKRLFNKTVGILAVLFLSFSTVHYMMSVNALADMTSMFFLILSIYFLLKYFAEPNIRKDSRYFCISGFILGLAVAAKWLAAPGVVCFLAIHYFKEKRLISSKLIWGPFFILVGFCLGTIPAFFDLGKLWSEFYLTYEHLSEGYMSIAKVTPPVVSYIFEWLPNALGIVSSFVFLAGLIYFVFKRSRNIWFILLYPLTHFLLFQIMQATGFAYYLLPSLPFITIAMGAFLYKVSIRFKKWGSAFLVVVSILCFLNPAMDSLRYLFVITGPDTRTQAKIWIEGNIPNDSDIILEGALGNKLVQAPVLNENLETLKDSLEWTLDHGGSGRFQRLLIENYTTSRNSYRLYKVPQNFKEEDVLNTTAGYLVTCGFFDLDLGELEGYLDKDYYGKDYYKERRRVWEIIEKKFRLVKKFEPFPKFRYYYPLFFAEDYRTLRKINIFKDRIKVAPGPEVRIYKRIL